MRAGIIAAGDGSRLAELGMPKPLVRVGGQTLVERTLRQLVAAGFDRVSVIVNEGGRAVIDHIRALNLPIHLSPVVQTTPSSMHSLLALAPFLAPTSASAEDRRFVVCTVDSIIPGPDFQRFVSSFRATKDRDALLSYTAYVNDENPLRIGVDAAGRVTALGAAAEASPFVTVGAYGMGPRLIDLAARACAEGQTRLRNLLARAVDQGLAVYGHQLGKAIDVDRPQDVVDAEHYLFQGEAQTCTS